MTGLQEPDKVKKHNTKRAKYVYGLTGCAFLALALLYAIRSNEQVIMQYNDIDSPAEIRPEYYDTIIPPNIAPLNFVIQQEGSEYFVRIYSETGKPIEIFSRTGKITIPEQPWHNLLDLNRGRQLSMDIFVKSGSAAGASDTGKKQWSRFKTITNTIAKEDIDAFLVYRKIRPGHRTWREMGIYQRDLNNFHESLILDNGYFSWHPSGRQAFFSVNDVRLFLHSAANEVRDVIDFDSLVAYYLTDSGTVKTTSDLANSNCLETYPTWSPDGRYLYFCSAPITWTDRTIVPEEYDQIKYDLVRTDYDIDGGEWGPLETVLSAEDTGLSVLLPRVSPDGRWLLFCMCNYGCFPVYQTSSDLYIIDLEDAEKTGRFEYHRLDINSDKSESWHSFSSNSRWIAFSSKRDYGVFTRIYLAYLNEDGTASKPIPLPQQDPTFYDSCLWTYSVPELIIRPVRITREKLGKVVRSLEKIPVEMPVTMATPKVGTFPSAGVTWQSERE
jgi:hypothetical protein